MRKIILKLRIMLLKRSIKAWAAEVSQSGAAMTIIHKEQSQRYWQLAQLEQQHDTI